MLKLQLLGVCITLLLALGNGYLLERQEDYYANDEDQRSGMFFHDSEEKGDPVMRDYEMFEDEFRMMEDASVVSPEKCVKAHNIFRNLHKNTPFLKWDQGLAQSAQRFANELARRNLKKLYHDEKINKANGWGENVFRKDSQRAGNCADAVLSWYNEINNYNFNTGLTNGGVIGHFTQVVWKSSEKVGVGIAFAKSSLDPRNRLTYIVAKYSPGGNAIGKNLLGVMPLKPSGRRPRTVTQVDRTLCKIDGSKSCPYFSGMCSNQVVQDMCFKTCAICA